MNSLSTRRNPAYVTSPFASLLNFGREFDRLFEGHLEPEAIGPAFSPQIEVREDKDQVQVSIELPGVERKDVQVTFHDGVLTVAGERRQEREVKEDEYVRTERRYGRFERRVGFSQPVEADQVKAAFKDGVLTVTLPKTAEAKPKTIDIAG